MRARRNRHICNQLFRNRSRSEVAEAATASRAGRVRYGNTSVAYDEAAGHAYAGLPFKRARFDRLLAAHALSIGATVITNNEAHFADVGGLRVENWTV